jgi:hypothetical protein
MDLSKIFIIVQIISIIWGLISGIWVFLFGSMSVYEFLHKNNPKKPPKANQKTRMKTFLIISMVIAIIVLLSTFLLRALLPPDPRTVLIDLMDQEVVVSTNHDLPSVDRIYTPNAVVTDAACQPGDQFQTWNGREEIKTRYHDLPQFLSLAHINKEVTLIPNDSSAVKATATASTQGIFVMVAPNGTQKQISLGGNEHWEFSKIGDQWFITKFTFSIC